MKLNKLLTPILSLTTVSTVVAPIATSCSSEQNHVWLSSVDGIKKDADGNYSANYYFGLDKDTYTDKDIDVIINSSNRFDFKLTHFVTSKLLVVNVLYVKHPDEDVTAQFDLKIWTNDWSKQINWLEINVPKYVVTLDDYLDRYTIIRNHFLTQEQDQKYNTFKLHQGDYCISNGTKYIVSNQSVQKNELSISKSSEKYDTLFYQPVIDDTPFIGFQFSYTPDRDTLEERIKKQIEQGYSYTFYLPKNGYLGMEIQYTEQTSSYSRYISAYRLVNAKGYLVELKLHEDYSSGGISHSGELYYRISDYSKTE